MHCHEDELSLHHGKDLAGVDLLWDGQLFSNGWRQQKAAIVASTRCSQWHHDLSLICNTLNTSMARIGPRMNQGVRIRVKGLAGKVQTRQYSSSSWPSAESSTQAISSHSYSNSYPLRRLKTYPALSSRPNMAKRSHDSSCGWMPFSQPKVSSSCSPSSS